jgi:serine/threonine protein kinase
MGAVVTQVPHSPSVNEVWTRSEVLKFGADAHVRVFHSCADEFFVCKIALDTRHRLLLHDEFSLLRDLSSHSVPVVRTHPQPLMDEDSIFGFRMERLVDINIDTTANYIPDIESAINSIHQCGIVLHDISPTNIMLNQQGRITIIDLGQAGYVGKMIPPSKTIGIKPTAGVFSINADRLALDSIIGMCGTLSKNSIQLTPNFQVS